MRGAQGCCSTPQRAQDAPPSGPRLIQSQPPVDLRSRNPVLIACSGRELGLGLTVTTEGSLCPCRPSSKQLLGSYSHTPAPKPSPLPRPVPAPHPSSCRGYPPCRAYPPAEPVQGANVLGAESSPRGRGLHSRLRVRVEVGRGKREGQAGGGVTKIRHPPSPATHTWVRVSHWILVTVLNVVIHSWRRDSKTQYAKKKKIKYINK